MQTTWKKYATIPTALNTANEIAILETLAQSRSKITDKH